MFLVKITDCRGAVREVLVESLPFSIGASPRCAVQIEEEGVARVHFEVKQRSRRRVLRRLSDTGAMVRINGEPLCGAHILKRGDTLRLGMSVLEFLSPRAHQRREPPEFNTLLAEAREILYEHPSEPAWNRLCALLSRAECDETPLSDYVSTLLAQWPDSLRVAPRAWVDDFLKGGQGKKLSLVRRLELGHLLLSERDIRGLCSSPHLASVSELILGNTGLEDSGLSEVLQHKQDGNLRLLDLGKNRIFSANASLARHRESLRALETLKIGSNPLQDLPELHREAWFKRLRRLDLSHCPLSAANLMAMTGHFEHLEHFSMVHTALPIDVLSLLLSVEAPLLTELDLSSAQIDDDGLQKLAESPLLTSVRTLNLSYNKITTKGVLSFADSPHLKRLRTLRLSGNSVAHWGLKKLAESESLPSLFTLEAGR